MQRNDIQFKDPEQMRATADTLAELIKLSIDQVPRNMNQEEERIEHEAVIGLDKLNILIRAFPYMIGGIASVISRIQDAHPSEVDWKILDKTHDILCEAVELHAMAKLYDRLLELPENRN